MTPQDAGLQVAAQDADLQQNAGSQIAELVLTTFIDNAVTKHLCCNTMQS